MIRRLYFDTSVFGGIYDTEFERETALLFEKVGLGQILCVYSNLTENELSKAPQRIKVFFESIKQENREIVELTPEALKLAKTYIREKVVGATSLDDCIHIAIATLSKVDMLISWNFKHIVNANGIHGYNSENLRLGYSALEIRSPKDIPGNEDD